MTHRPTPKDMNAAALQERQAYQEMRDLLPGLHLPAAERPPLTREQANAVANYEHARERVRLLRAWFTATLSLGNELPDDTHGLDPHDQ